MAQHSPSSEELFSGLSLLQALSDPRRHDHSSAVGTLPTVVQQPGFVMLLCHFFSRGAQYIAQGVTLELRQMAGIIIKNYCIKIFAQEPGSSSTIAPAGHLVETLRETLILCLIDESHAIRKTAASLLGRIADSYPHMYWSPILPYLISALQIHCGVARGENVDASLASPSALDGALLAIVILFEDAPDKLAMDPLRPTHIIVPLLLELFRAPQETPRLNSITALNSLITSPYNEPLLLHMSTFLSGLGVLAVDPIPAIRRAVCQALVLLVSSHGESLQSCFPDICAFMLRSVLDNDESVAIEACEFWLALLDEPLAHAVLQEQLHTLVPTCISRLRLTQAQVDREREDEEAQADGSKDIKFPSRRKSNRGSTGSSEDDFHYTIRKECAFLLDNLAVAFPKSTLDLAAPVISTYLQSSSTDSSWEREFGILAFGAIATGCGVLLKESVTSVLPIIMISMEDPLQETRGIACWCLSRYAGWIEEMLYENPAHGQSILTSAIQRLLGALQDKKPRVQSAACSALCSLVSTVDTEFLNPFLEAIVTQISNCWSIYGLKNKLLLIDVLGELGSAGGDRMNDPKLTALFLPHVFSFFQQNCTSYFTDPSSELLVIAPIECFTALFVCMPDQLVHVASDTMKLCLHLVQWYLEQSKFAVVKHGTHCDGRVAELIDTDGEIEDNHTGDVAICALDLMSSMAEGLKGSFPMLLRFTLNNIGDANGKIDGNSYDFILGKQVLQCLENHSSSIRSSALSLVGELSRYSPPTILPQSSANIFAAIFQALSIEINDSSDDIDTNLQVINNAVWCSGLVAVALGSDGIDTFLPKLLHSLVQLFHSASDESGQLNDALLRTNLCITIGRLVSVSSIAVISIFPDIVLAHLVFMGQLQPPLVNTESLIAWNGLISALIANPSLLGAPESQSLFKFAVDGAMWSNAKNPIDLTLRGTLEHFLRILPI